MPFTNTSLSTTSLLETTFISDMRIIVNSNTTVLKNKIEDIINNLQIDLVNRYLGVDQPLGNVYTNGLTVSSGFLFKNGTASSAATIASLTQSSGYSTFLSDNIQFTRVLKATSTSSRAALRTIVVGGTSGSTDLSYPTSAGAGIADPGLYVGDTSTPISAGFYGDVTFAKRAITQSYSTSGGRVVSVTRVGGTYSHGILALSKNDPQFIPVDIQLSDTGSQDSAKPIWIQLHEDFTSTSSRPNVGQSFTVVVNNIYNLDGTAVAVANWPAVEPSTSTNGGLAIMPGYAKNGTAGSGAYKIGYINNATWASGSFPDSGTSAVANVGTSMDVKTFVRLFNESVQSDPSNPDILGANITLTKISESTDFSRYIITGGSNYAIVNS
jgi:hypothetical protein